MHSLTDIDRWQDLEKTYPNLTYGLSSRVKINVCGHIYEIYTGGWVGDAIGTKNDFCLNTPRNPRCLSGDFVG